MKTTHKSIRRKRTGKAAAAKPSTAKPRLTLEEIMALPAFGMWKDYPGTVEDYMRKVRKPRFESLFDRDTV